MSYTYYVPIVSNAFLFEIIGAKILDTHKINERYSFVCFDGIDRQTLLASPLKFPFVFALERKLNGKKKLWGETLPLLCEVIVVYMTEEIVIYKNTSNYIQKRVNSFLVWLITSSGIRAGYSSRTTSRAFSDFDTCMINVVESKMVMPTLQKTRLQEVLF